MPSYPVADTRVKFKRSHTLLERNNVSPLNVLLNDAGLKPAQIDEAVLVGGPRAGGG